MTHLTHFQTFNIFLTHFHQVNVYPALFMFENDKKLKHACKRRKKEDIIQFVDKFLKTAPADGSGE